MLLSKINENIEKLEFRMNAIDAEKDKIKLKLKNFIITKEKIVSKPVLSKDDLRAGIIVKHVNMDEFDDEGNYKYLPAILIKCCADGSAYCATFKNMKRYNMNKEFTAEKFSPGDWRFDQDSLSDIDQPNLKDGRIRTGEKVEIQI